MHFMNLIMLSDYIQVLNSIRKYRTKIEHLYKHILFSTIYLLHEQKLNPSKYSEKEINMQNFVQAKGYDMIMYEFPGNFKWKMNSRNE
jgi:hypothetical protein